jgi:hypothetical protein
MKSFWMRVMVASAALLVVVLVGCNNSPVDSLSATSTFDNSQLTTTPPTGPILLKARVEMINQEQRMLTFEGIPDTVIANHNCQITRLLNENESPIPFVNIKLGDSCDIHGERLQDGYVYAWHIKVCGDSGMYDLAFRDTIKTIDYTLGQFTVVGRNETILIDSNTAIWGITSNWSYHPGNETSQPAASKVTPGDGGYSELHRIDYLFTDLTEGDVLEIRAMTIDENTLLAVYIIVANCEEKAQCVEFESTIATIDYTTRMMTFADQTWLGWACPGADLTDAAGETLTLDAFLVGDAVAVKGLPLEGDTLKVSAMQKL